MIVVIVLKHRLSVCIRVHDDFNEVLPLDLAATVDKPVNTPDIRKTIQLRITEYP